MQYSVSVDTATTICNTFSGLRFTAFTRSVLVVSHSCSHAPNQTAVQMDHRKTIRACAVRCVRSVDRGINCFIIQKTECTHGYVTAYLHASGWPWPTILGAVLCEGQNNGTLCIESLNFRRHSNADFHTRNSGTNMIGIRVCMNSKTSLTQRAPPF